MHGSCTHVYTQIHLLSGNRGAHLLMISTAQAYTAVQSSQKKSLHCKAYDLHTCNDKYKIIYVELTTRLLCTGATVWHARNLNCPGS